MNSQMLTFKAAENTKTFGETATDNNAQMGSSHFDISKIPEILQSQVPLYMEYTRTPSAALNTNIVPTL